MGFLDRFSKLADKSREMMNINSSAEYKEGGQVTVGKVTSEAVKNIITDLSGGEVELKTKLIDNVIVMTNVSGGTGVSTLVSNMGYIAKQKGLRVMVIDLNIMNPVQDSAFNIEPMMERPDLVGYLTGKNDLKSAIITDANFSIMFANNRTLMDYIICEDDSCIQNYEQMLYTLRKTYDLILIDCPNNINHCLVNAALYNADHIYLVWDESLTSILNTEKFRRNLIMSGVNSYSKTSIILNKRTDCTYGKYPFEKMTLKLEEILPFDPAIIECSLKSQIFVDKAATDSENANIFFQKAYSLTDKILENGGYIEPKKVTERLKFNERKAKEKQDAKEAKDAKDASVKSK